MDLIFRLLRAVIRLLRLMFELEVSPWTWWDAWVGTVELAIAYVGRCHTEL
jgi:hypothetical protein